MRNVSLDSRKPHPGIPVLLTTRQLAARLGVPASTIHFWRTKGTAPRAFKLGKELRFREDDVVEWLEAKRAAAA
jgi:excisionase family DNA binding protein